MRSLLVLLCGSILAITAAESDALAISAAINARFVPYGTILSPVYGSATSNQIIGYSRCGDSAIWTGHHLAAEALRYASTKSPNALVNVRRALAGIQILFDVTGTNTLARCAFPTDSPFGDGMASEEINNGVYHGNIDGKAWTWIGNTSRDQYVGVFFGLTVVWNVVEDAAIQNQVRTLVTRAMDRLLARNWSIVLPYKISTTFLLRPDQQLMLAKLARRVDPDKYNGLYADLSKGAIAMVIPITIDVQDEHSSYFKFNLAYDTFYGLLAQGYAGSDVVILARGLYDRVRRTTENHGNAHFNMIDNAIRGQEDARDAQTRMLLGTWLKRPKRDDFVDLRSKYSSCGAADKACQVLPVDERVRTDFLWQRSPFLLYGGGTGTIEGPGIDYTLPYWMGRFFKVIAD